MPLHSRRHQLNTKVVVVISLAVLATQVIHTSSKKWICLLGRRGTDCWRQDVAEVKRAKVTVGEMRNLNP